MAHKGVLGQDYSEHQRSVALDPYNKRSQVDRHPLSGPVGRNVNPPYLNSRDDNPGPTYGPRMFEQEERPYDIDEALPTHPLSPRFRRSA